MDGQSVFIQELPEELLEYIFGLVSPYNDFRSLNLVCKQWNRLVKGLVGKISRSFKLAIKDCNIKWTSVKADSGQTITKRYSHCASYFDKSVYVCSGCTVTNTTFNDIWRFDLTTRKWVRPLAVGAYPSPKGCASLVVYKDNLVLYGGWSHPTPYPLHQTSKFFSELDMFNPETNRWSHISCLSPFPPPMAGHSASVVNHYMVVFGGSQAPGVGSNSIYVFDFFECIWSNPSTVGVKPNPRYGQTQCTLDDKHILIMGGCGGANQIFADVWLLEITDSAWIWKEVKLENTEYAAPQLWCHPACRVGNSMVVLSKSARPSTPPATRPLPVQRQTRPQPHPHLGRNNPLINEPGPSRRSNYDDSSSDDPDAGEDNDGFAHPADAGTASVRPGLPSVRPNAMTNRQKQLETLRKYEQRFKQTMKPAEHSDISTPRRPLSPMYLHVLDISNVITETTATWRPYKDIVTEHTPDETVFFSLVHGRGELIMFGGIEKDINSMQRGREMTSLSVSNSVYIVSAKDFKLG